MSRLASLTLKERKRQEALREQEIQHALTHRSKALEKSKQDKKQKKKSVGELLCLIHYCGIEGRALQSASTYVPKSYNLDKQVIGLINHMFVRYPVPPFLYEAFQKESKENKVPFKEKQEMYRQWFVTLAQGGSFTKLVKGYLTSREAFLFLSAPAANHIHENVWWAKMRVAGLPVGIIEKLIERIFAPYFFDDPQGRLAEVIQFYARFHTEMNRVTFGEVTDFLAWKLRQDRTFSLKGRTISSVIKLTNEWHLLIQKAKLGHNIEWKGMELPDWEFEARDRIWSVVELRNNRELMNEGRKQKHCVYSYVHWCVAGRSAIFSLRGYHKQVAGYTEEGQILWDKSLEQTRVTIEVNSHRFVVQVRGPLNRQPTEEEARVLRHWAGEKGMIQRA